MRHTIRRLLPVLSLLSLVAIADGAITACSSPTSGEDASCAALSTCCVTVPGQSAASCQQIQQAAQQTGTSCAQLLQSYQADGYCGGNDGGAAPGLDGGSVSCVLTGTCDAGSSSPPSGSTSDPTPTCETLGTCADGETYATCVETATGGACAASVVLSGGAKFPCASCTDCAAASASAALVCNPPASPDEDAGSPVDSGPSCGTAPVLHPESAPGVYCPFTAAGAVHCSEGQECCEAPAGDVSSCQAGGATCPVTGSVTWACADPLDCQGNAAGPVCCATGATTFDAVCGFNRGTGFTGSQCATSCGAGQIQICSAASDPCTGTTQCTPFKVDGLVLGTCL